MDITHCRTTDADLALDNLISLDEDYKTIPIFAISPNSPRPDEEELHIQFEEALRKRATTSRSRLKHPESTASLNYNVQRVLIYCCFALSCILLGFDLMGLLILHMR
jgi:hypothetical protein